MGLWKNVLLVTGGLAAGYLASRASKAEGSGSTDLVARPERVIQEFVGEHGSVAKFLDSKYGAPLKASALGALRFAANVKAGMDEKEAELKQRFEDQKQDLRPGSIDSWAQGSPRLENSGDTPEILDSTLASGAETLQEREARIRARLARDAELGKDFFS